MGLPVLPIIDLLIVLGWTTMAAGGVLKAIYITTPYRPTFAGLVPSDLILVAFAFLLLALTIVARTWVRVNEPRLAARRAAEAVTAATAANAAATLESYSAVTHGVLPKQAVEPEKVGIVPVRRAAAPTAPGGVG